jgi:hypothetical protein
MRFPVEADSKSWRILKNYWREVERDAAMDSGKCGEFNQFRGALQGEARAPVRAELKLRHGVTALCPSDLRVTHFFAARELMLHRVMAISVKCDAVFS